MDGNKINISKIETFLYERISGKVSDNTYVGSKLPDKAAIPVEWADLCLIDIPNGIKDFDSYGKGTALVYLFARPMESGRKNVAVLSEMEKALNQVIENTSDDTYGLSRRLTFTGFDTNIDWHYNVIEITILVL